MATNESAPYAAGESLPDVSEAEEEFIRETFDGCNDPQGSTTNTRLHASVYSEEMGEMRPLCEEEGCEDYTNTRGEPVAFKFRVWPCYPKNFRDICTRCGAVLRANYLPDDWDPDTDQ